MSKRQTMSASMGASSTGLAAAGTMNEASAVNGPSFPSAMPSTSRQIASQRFVTTYTRSSSIVAVEQMPSFMASKSSLRPITQADLAALTERVRGRVSRWFRRAGLLDAAAAADMLAWENSGFSVDASVRITLIDRDVPSYFRSLEHLLRYCARPPFALERLSVIRGPDGRITHIRYVLPRHKAANWVGPGRGRKSTRPGANGVVELSPFEFLDRLADLVPPPRKHRHRYHGVFAPNHKLRKAVTALAIGNVGKRSDAGHAGDGHATGCCDANHATLKHRSHDT
ncbi:MAG: hypothetical protein FJ286_10865, partial [Planctomycetes bacterium]|nr:hypothetical protein [Planctomycetota bacterium]